MKRTWVKVHGTTSKSGLDDFPTTNILTEEGARQTIVDFVEEEMEQFWGETGGSWDGTVVDDERVNQLMDVVLEGEDTLFAKVDEAKKELVEIIWKQVLDEEGFWFLFNDYSDGWFWQIELKEVP